MEHLTHEEVASALRDRWSLQKNCPNLARTLCDEPVCVGRSQHPPTHPTLVLDLRRRYLRSAASARGKFGAHNLGSRANRTQAPVAETVKELLESPAPTRDRERLLHVIGWHPCLTVGQLAGLLGTRVDRIRRLEMELIHDGLLRQIDFGELPPCGTGLTRDEFALLGLVEATSWGQRLTASWFGLGRAAAVRYHGLSGHGSRDSGLWWRLLRTLQHTPGVNDVFVALPSARRHSRMLARAMNGGAVLPDSVRGAPRARCDLDITTRFEPVLVALVELV
jgi:hypothetical protein